MNAEPCKLDGRLLIVDGHAYAYRAFYAIRELNSPEGKPTNAIYGFIKMLMKMIGSLKPSHVIIVWDGGLAEERTALLPEYKAQRPPMPGGLETQLDEIVAYLRAASMTSYCGDGLEADDFIATIARVSVAAGLPVVIASSDKDFMQLVSEKVCLLNPGDKTETLCGAGQVKAKTGVEPSQIVDWLSLIGDAVDNIPGVPGVGPKTATDLLGEFGDIDSIYGQIERVKSARLKQSLLNSESQIRRNRKLIRLKDDLPCEFSVSDLSLREGDFVEMRRLFSGWGFKGLLHELEKAQVKSEELFRLN